MPLRGRAHPCRLSHGARRCRDRGRRPPLGLRSHWRTHPVRFRGSRRRREEWRHRCRHGPSSSHFSRYRHAPATRCPCRWKRPNSSRRCGSARRDVNGRRCWGARGALAGSARSGTAPRTRVETAMPRFEALSVLVGRRRRNSSMALTHRGGVDQIRCGRELRSSRPGGGLRNGTGPTICRQFVRYNQQLEPRLKPSSAPRGPAHREEDGQQGSVGRYGAGAMGLLGSSRQTRVPRRPMRVSGALNGVPRNHS
jgi:hypothetical protein